MDTNMIKVRSLYKNFEKTEVLKGIDFDIQAHSQVVIQGPSGSGKSTLLYLLGGLDIPTSGEIAIHGRSLIRMNEEMLAKFRNREVGFVFQFHFLLPSMKCMDNILLPSRIAREYTGELKKRVLDLSHHLGIDHCLNKYPYELSGGEQQRVSLVRAVSMRPKLLLCDEPTGNLDSINSQRVIDLLKELAQQTQATLIVVTHDERIAAGFSHRMLMKDGKLTIVS